LEVYKKLNWNNIFEQSIDNIKLYFFVRMYIITNILGFIGLYKLCAKSNFHNFMQKLNEFHAMVNMNDIFIYSIF
jgi:hypothetical protein